MKRENDILAEVRGFMRSRVILTAAELDFFTQLHDNAATASELAEMNSLDVRGSTRVLDCLVTFGLVRKEDGRYHLTEEAEILSSKHRETVLPMVLHLNHLWDTWGHLTETIREGAKNRSRKPITQRGEATLNSFIAAMNVIGRDLAKEIAAAYDAGSFKSFLDIGSGSGTYSVAFLSRNPQMHATLFDLEEVIPMAQDRLDAEGLLGRVRMVAGDFYSDELPRGCDLALLSAIIHQNSPEQNVDLYGKVYRALEPGGVLLIRDHIMDEARTWPPSGAVFAINMLVGTAGGDTYTFPEVKQTLEKAGFVDVKLVRRGENMDCLVEARKE